jgi:hypothetical protein
MKRKENLLFYALVLASTITVAINVIPGFSAENLKLAPGISYDSDLGNQFPITADKMEDMAIDSARPTLIFFGAVGDMNTNRQAKRLVELYKKESSKTKFVVVNVDNPANGEARSLIRKHYPGYVPAQLLLDPSGKVVWSQVGEVSRRKLRGQIYNTM